MIGADDQLSIGVVDDVSTDRAGVELPTRIELASGVEGDFEAAAGAVSEDGATTSEVPVTDDMIWVVDSAGIELPTTTGLTSGEVGVVEPIAGVVADDGATTSEVLTGETGLVDLAGAGVSVKTDAVDGAIPQS